MRFVRVPRPDGPAFGVVQDEYVVLIDGHPFAQFTLTDQVAPLNEVRLLAPVLPSKVVGVGKNYADHAAEMGQDLPSEPLIFSKPATSVIGPDEVIRMPAASERVDHEAELAVVVGGLVRKVSPESAVESILGYTCANDVTARDLQARDGQWTRAKGFDSFCPLGPWIDTAVAPGPGRGQEAQAGGGLAVRCSVGGEVRQAGATTDMVFSPAALVSWVSWVMTLLPGDVILTGTPAGVGPLADGDSVDVDIQDIGTLHNLVEHDR